MEIKLTPAECESIFHTALCNAVGNGYMNGYGLELTCDRSQYKDCRDHLQRIKPNETICYEDILMQVLRDGGSLTFIDNEGDGEYTSSVTMSEVYSRMTQVDPENILNILNEVDDATDADIVLQTIFFEDVIFG